MATRTVLLALVLLLPSIAEAKPRPRTVAVAREVVQVIDRTSTAWNGIVQETVDDFNAIMPPKGPILRYVRGGVGCASEIPVCSGALPDNVLGLAWYYPGDRYASIQVTDTWPLDQEGKEAVACHEFMHALTHIGDNYGGNSQSCVWGRLPDPGIFDIDYLYRYFGNTPPPHPKAHAKHKKPCKGIKNKQNRMSCQRNHRR
jgi:hypothetical protein